jgi:hypothetical protein
MWEFGTKWGFESNQAMNLTKDEKDPARDYE